MTDPRLAVVRDILDARRAELSSALHSTAEDTRDVRPASGGWSVAMVVEHLVDTERSITRLMSAFVDGAGPRSPGDGFDAAAFRRRLDMPAFLDRTRKLKFSQPSGSMSAASAWDALGATRAALIEVLERGAGRRLEDASRPHPVGIELDGYQWLAFLALHEARHAAQIAEIRGAE